MSARDPSGALQHNQCSEHTLWRFAEGALRFTFSAAKPPGRSPNASDAVANIQVITRKLGVSAQVKVWSLTIDQMNRYSSP